MDWSVVGGVVGSLALIGVVFQLRSYFLDHPKRQLEYTVTSRRLVESAPQAKLEVRVSGIEVPDPHLVEFRLRSNSRADIPTSAFDNGNAIKVRVEPGGAFPLDLSGEIRATGGASRGWESAEFQIKPQRIGKGSVLALDFISNGEPGVRVDSPLIDVPIVDATRRSKTVWTTVSSFATIGLASLLPIVLVALIPTLFKGDSLLTSTVVAVLLGCMTLVFTIAVGSILPRIRDRNL